MENAVQEAKPKAWDTSGADPTEVQIAKRRACILKRHLGQPELGLRNGQPLPSKPACPFELIKPPGYRKRRQINLPRTARQRASADRTARRNGLIDELRQSGLVPQFLHALLTRSQADPLLYGLIVALISAQITPGTPDLELADSQDIAQAIRCSVPEIENCKRRLERLVINVATSILNSNA